MAFIIGKCQLFIPEMCIGVLTTFIQACSLNRKRKAHKITCLYPLEIPDLKPPDAFGIPIVSTPLAFGIPVQRTPLAFGIPKSRPSYCTDIFWNCPIRLNGRAIRLTANFFRFIERLGPFCSKPSRFTLSESIPLSSFCRNCLAIV